MTAQFQLLKTGDDEQIKGLISTSEFSPAENGLWPEDCSRVYASELGFNSYSPCLLRTDSVKGFVAV
jgi:hypothetical protein